MRPIEEIVAELARDAAELKPEARVHHLVGNVTSAEVLAVCRTLTEALESPRRHGEELARMRLGADRLRGALRVAKQELGEEYRRRREAIHDGERAIGIVEELEQLLGIEPGEDIAFEVRALIGAECSANASRLTEELVRLDGRARELVEQKLGIEADRLAASEQQLRDLERDAAELEIARKDHAWFVAALRDFAKVWVNMSPDNQGRFLRALIDKVVVDEDKGTCRVELIDFGAASGTKEAA